MKQVRTSFQFKKDVKTLWVSYRGEPKRRPGSFAKPTINSFTRVIFITLAVYVSVPIARLRSSTNPRGFFYFFNCCRVFETDPRNFKMKLKFVYKNERVKKKSFVKISETKKLGSPKISCTRREGWPKVVLNLFYIWKLPVFTPNCLIFF